MLNSPLEITEEDIPGHVPAVDPTQEIQNKVAPRVAEARLLKVIDQATLNLAIERLEINSGLQLDANRIFDKSIKAAHNAHVEALAAKRSVTEPLTEEARLIKLVIGVFDKEQKAIAAERARVAQAAQEAEARRLFAIAEAEAKERTRLENERIRREHEAEVERAFESMPADTPDEVLEEIANTPAPSPIRIEAEVPVLPKVVIEPTYTMPKGTFSRKTYKAEVTSITTLCAAVAKGEVPSSYVSADMVKLNARARADGVGMSVPGVKVVEDSSIVQRGR